MTMLRSKRDVDRHVRDVLNKIKTEDERKVRGYNISRLYYNIHEYESARRYLSEFLTVRPKAMDAHRLLGQIFEGLGNKEKAVLAYKTSYELGGQKDLVLKICELYTDVQCDSSVRLYWADEGHRLFPHHESVVKLREALITGSEQHSREELEKLYLDEIKARPTVVRLYTSLLRLYKDWSTEDKNKINDAYNYGCQVEARKAFSESLEWYQTLFDIMEAYRINADVNNDVAFHTNYIWSLERLVYLTLASSSRTALLSQCTLTDAAQLLHRFDQNLTTSLNVIGQNSAFGQLMIGQLYFHMAVFLMHSAKKDGLTHTSTKASALLFHACRFRSSESGHHPPKSATSSEQCWFRLACHRLSQAAHVLSHMAKTELEKTKFLNRVRQQCSNKETQEEIYVTLFGASLANEKEESFFLKDDQFVSASMTYPEPDQVKEWDNVVAGMYCWSLRDLVWLCLQQQQQPSASLKDAQPYYTFPLFEGLQFSSSSINSGAPESLCYLDLLAFLAATVYCQIAASKQLHGPAPASLPTVVTSALNTTEQDDWWSAAYTLFTNRAHHRLSKLRLTLQRGLEVIRAIGNHGIELDLMAHLAHCFTKWASTAKEGRSSASEVDALEERAEHYWQRVLTLCQRAARNVTSVPPRNLLFLAQNGTMSPEERDKVEEEGKLFLAMRLVQAGKQQEAIQALADLKSPEASFQRAMLYKQQAKPETGSNTIFLTQARDTLYLTLDRLRMPGVDRFHPLNTKLSQQLEDVERRLSHITVAQDNGVQREDDMVSVSDASQSPPNDTINGHMPSAIHSPHVFSTPYRDNRNSTRIARQEARPSPERLDAQVRALSDVMENTLRNVEEQNTALRSQNEALRDMCTTMADEMKENATLYRSMIEQYKSLSQESFTSVINELKQIHSSIKDLQTQMQSYTVEIAELKEIKAAEKQRTDAAEVKTAEEQVTTVDLPPGAVVPGDLYNKYINYYGQHPLPQPILPTPGLFGNPPFFPPSTLPEQSYSLTSVSQGTAISNVTQASATMVTPAYGSPASMTIREAVNSPSGDAVPQIVSSTSLGTVGWSCVTPSIVSSAHLSQVVAATALPGTITTSATTDTVAAAPHAFQITMPVVSSSLTPPGSTSVGEQMSLSLPSSTTGLLANVPAPLYSAVTPNTSPLRGNSQAQSMATVLSPEGLSTEAESLEAPSATSGSQDGSLIGVGSPTKPQTVDVSPVKTHDVSDDNERYVDDDHDPCPDFKPVVPLPEKVEVRTGEEDEEVLFEERSKLFRFLEKEWRERGTGVMKLLHNPSQGSVRVLMRRDQTHKICANHLVSSQMELQPMENLDKAWIWAAQDYADEELRMEKFCCRFKTKEIALKFKEAFVKAKDIAKEKEESTVQQEEEATPAESSTEERPKSLAEMFKPVAGSWSCRTCLVTNTPEKTKCAACETPNPDAPKTEEPSTEKPSPFLGFKFGASNGNTGIASIGSSPTVATTTTSSTEAPKSTSKFSLGGFTFSSTPKQDKVDDTSQKPQEDEKKKESIFAGFSFGVSSLANSSSCFTFSTATAESKSEDSTAGGTVITTTTTASTPATGLFSGTANTGNFLSFGGVASCADSSTTLFTTKDTKAFEPKTSKIFGDSKDKSPSKDESDEKVEEYEPQVDFQPVIPMPDLVEVKTGEEEEEKLFCERAKLFRYDVETKEWKERGVGDLKILKNTITGKVRVLMRREQIHKVCANHFLTPEIKITPMATSDKAWIWAAHDFADEEMKEEKFAARFKTQELGLSFKEAFEKAQKSLEATPVNIPSTSVTAVPSSEAPKTESLATLFKPAAGSWECDGCLLRNTAETNTCVACSTNRPGYEPPKETTTPAFSFGIKSVTPTLPTDNSSISKSTSKEPKTSLAEMFKPAAGSWECESCLVRNKAEDTSCVSCGSGSSGAPSVAVPSADSVPTFNFGIPATTSVSGGFSFTSTDSKPAFSFGIPSSNQNVSSTTAQPINFGVSSYSDQDTGSTSSSSSSSNKPAMLFGSNKDQPNKAFSFTWQPPVSVNSITSSASTSAFSSSTFTAPVTSGPIAIPSAAGKEQATTPTKDENSGFVFGSPGKYEFSFTGVKGKSPRSRDISICESEDGVVEEDEGDHLYFEPVVPLPDKVDVVTGEEEEQVLYSHRAKLFRLVAGEWKERGLGDVKLLEHNQTGKIRMLMRREQVLKICLNHYIQKDLEFRKKDDKTLIWAAIDYTETEPQNETFAIRFKTPEISAEFCAAVCNAKVKLGGTPEDLPSIISSTPVKEESPDNVGTPLSRSTPHVKSTKADSTTTTPSAFGEIPNKPTIGNNKSSVSQSLFGGSPLIFGGGVGGNDSGGGALTFSTNVSASFTLKTPDQSTTDITSTTTKPSVKFYNSSESDSSDVEVVYEKKATPDQVAKAQRLQLPDNFFLYEDAPPCPGCPGCEDSTDHESETGDVIGCDTTSTGPSTTSVFNSTDGSTEFASKLFAQGVTISPFSGGNKSSSKLGDSTKPTTPSIFGKSATTNLFGNSTSTTPSFVQKPFSIFGGKTSTDGTVSSTTSSAPAFVQKPFSIFGGKVSTDSSESSSVDGSATATGTVFGGSAPGTGTPGSIFGGASTVSIFGGSTTLTNTTPSIFGGSTSTTGTTASPFGLVTTSAGTSGSLFKGTTTVTKTSGSLFGGPTPSTGTSLFGGTGTTGTSNNSIFGGSTIFGAKSSGSPATLSNSVSNISSDTTATDPTIESTPVLFSSINKSSLTSFGDVAAQSSATSFGSSSPQSASVWATRGQPVFSKSPKKAGDEDEEGDENDAHDPYFEPVVPLPDLVEVKTGEEGLEVLFCQRGKLYRYDAPSKQWKERGVGDMKILYDAAINKFRLLQRREKVHKTCCNHYLTTQLDLVPMQSSETAYCWYATDFSESLDGTNEQLAIRFKTPEIANEFKMRFDECQERLRNSLGDSSAATATAVVSNVSQGRSSPVQEEEEHDSEESEEEDEDDDDDDDEDDDDDDTSVIFNKRCTLYKKENGNWATLGMGELRIIYDDDVFGARIKMTSDGNGETLAEHIIAIQTRMHKEKNCATWTVLNLEPQPQATTTFKAQFSSMQALEEFASAFTEGKEYAEKSGIAEQMCEEVAPEELYYGQGADVQGMVQETYSSESAGEWLQNKGPPSLFPGQVLTCDPNLTREIAAALQEHFPSLNTEHNGD